MVTRAEIVEYARTWIGVRYRHQGRSRRFGLDCAGLMFRVGNDLGILKWETHNYHRFPTDTSFYKEFNKGGFIRTDVQLGGVIAVVKIAGIPCHVGILTGEETIVHAHAPHRKVVETAYNPINTDAHFDFPLING